MTDQNNLIALQWVLPEVKHSCIQLDKILAASVLNAEQIEEAVSILEQIKGSFSLIVQDEMAVLTDAIIQLMLALKKQKIDTQHTNTAKSSINLLEYEVDSLSTNYKVHTQLISNRVAYIREILGHQHSHTLDSTIILNTLPELPEQELTLEQIDALKKVWRVNQLALLKLNEFDSSKTSALIDICQHLAQHYNNLKSALWQLTQLWLECALLSQQNSTTNVSPIDYSALLSQLDNQIVEEDGEASLSETHRLISDVLVAINNLPEHTQEASKILAKTLNQQYADKSYHILDKVVYNLDLLAGMTEVNTQDITPQELIEKITYELKIGGWKEYANKADHIDTLIKQQAQTSNDKSVIDTATKELIDALSQEILATTDSIELQLGCEEDTIVIKATQAAIRESRLAIERLKQAVNSYTHHQDLTQFLDDFDVLSGLAGVFDVLNLKDASQALNDVRALVAELQHPSITSLSWDAIDLLAELVTTFELFLDRLAMQVYDSQLVNLSTALVSKAQPVFLALQNQDVTLSDRNIKDNAVQRYDDQVAVEIVEEETSANHISNDQINQSNNDASNFAKSTIVTTNMTNNNIDSTSMSSEDDFDFDLDIEDYDVAQTEVSTVDETYLSENGNVHADSSEASLQDSSGFDEVIEEVVEQQVAEVYTSDDDFNIDFDLDDDTESYDDALNIAARTDQIASDPSSDTSTSEDNFSLDFGQGDKDTEAQLSASHDSSDTSESAAVPEDDFNIDLDEETSQASEIQDKAEGLDDDFSVDFEFDEELSQASDMQEKAEGLDDDFSVDFEFDEELSQASDMQEKAEGPDDDFSVDFDFDEETSQASEIQDKAEEAETSPVSEEDFDVDFESVEEEVSSVGQSSALPDSQDVKEAFNKNTSSDDDFSLDIDFDEDDFDPYNPQSYEDNDATALLGEERPHEYTSTRQVDEPIDPEQLEQIKANLDLLEDDFDFDQEIVEIFIEEAKEVLEEMAAPLQTWRQYSGDVKPLEEIRRGFHTLRGSGRLVGAHSVAATARSVETLLDNVLNHTVRLTDRVIDLVVAVYQQMPSLIYDFQQQKEPMIDIKSFIAQSHILQDKDVDSRVIADTSTHQEADVANVYDDELQDLQSDEGDAVSDQEDTTDDTLSTPVDPSITADKPIATAVSFESITPWYDKFTLPEDASSDEEITEIFIEEAEEVLADITPKIQALEPHQDEALADVRRGYHTLKGSGRMVGANQIGELSWSVENMLNRVLDNTVALNDQRLAYIQDVTARLPQLVKSFESQTPYTLNFEILIAIGYALSDSKADFNYLAIQHGVLAHVDNEGVAPTQEAAVEVEAQIDSGADSKQTETSQDIVAIFLEEAADIVEKIRAWHDSHTVGDELDDDYVRYYHTLRGGASLSNAQPLYQLCAATELQAEALIAHDSDLNEAQFDILQVIVIQVDAYLKQLATQGYIEDTGIDDLLEQVHCLNNSDTALELKKVSVGDLIALGIDELLEAEWELESKLGSDSQQNQQYLSMLANQATELSKTVKRLPKLTVFADKLALTYQRLSDQQPLLPDDDVIEKLIHAQRHLTLVFDAIAAGQRVPIDLSAIDELNAINKSLTSADNQASDTEGLSAVPTNTPSTDLAPQTMAVAALPKQVEIVEADDDLLSIFIEEAKEIEEDIERSFTDWMTDPSNRDALAELQRYLHTVKGGARMVGVKSIGDLTHEAEFVYEALVNNKLEPTPELVTLMRAVQDQLAEQIDELIADSQVTYSPYLTEQMQAALKGEDFSFEEEVAPRVETMPMASTSTASTVASSSNEDTTPAVNIDTTTWDNPPDEQILSIFIEEADELSESSSSYLQAFLSNTGDVAALSALQRDLHTLKGGARMVGVDAIALLAHEMEYIYEGLGNHRIPATKKVTQLLEMCHDWLADSIRLVRLGHNPNVPQPLVDSLKRFIADPDSLTELPDTASVSLKELITKYKVVAQPETVDADLNSIPAMSGYFGQNEETKTSSSEMVRISSGLLESLINASGEAAINRARIEMGMSSITNTVEEMRITVQRLADQLRRMDIELEAQILAQIDEETIENQEADFDPLEMDQYSSLNQLSKSLSESASDLLDINMTMLDKTRDTENLLLQLSRIQNDVQEGLMNSRLVPFSHISNRLHRIVRQTAKELGKEVQFTINDNDSEIDRTILERITSPLEHMLRNAVDHGIETPAVRTDKGKTPEGHIVLSLERAGNEIAVSLTDDGKGINVDAVRNKAIENELISADADISDHEIIQYIFNAGLTTASSITQISGRGVGMDVVQSEIKQLGGAVSVQSTPNQGSVFNINVPLTVAVTDALIVKTADRQYAIPLVQIERIVRLDVSKILKFYESDAETIDIDGEQYRLKYLNNLLYSSQFNRLSGTGASLPVIIVKNPAGQRFAVQVDELSGSRTEVVIKPLQHQLAKLNGITAATIMGDGSVMLILDLLILMRQSPTRSKQKIKQIKQAAQTERQHVLIVDDSVTVRKVSSRLLERNGYDVSVAKDGLDALEVMQELVPDIILLDIEMPRMDGFEVATQVRNTQRLKHVPIIMITSRTGEKHRERAFSLGVNDYMGKPFQEQEMLASIKSNIKDVSEQRSQLS